MFRRVLALLGLVLCLALPQHARAANLLVNGGFETPVQGPPNFAAFNVPAGSSLITGWTIVQGNVDLTTDANYGAGPDSLHPGSVQDIDLIGDTNGSGGVKGGLSQSFATIAGQSYRLTFDYSHNNGTFSANGYAASVTVADGNPPGSTIYSGAVSQPFVSGQLFGQSIWQAFSQDFIATSDLTTLTIIDTQGAFNAGIYLDEVDVEPLEAGATPLPSALPLLVSGLGIFGLIASGKRKRKAVAA